MKHRFLVHSLNHTVLTVNITEIGLPNQHIEAGGQRYSVPSIWFKSWSDAEEYFSKLGVKSEELVRLRENLRKTSLAVFTVPWPIGRVGLRFLDNAKEVAWCMMAEVMQNELKPMSFFFDGAPAGYFERDQFPSEPGSYRYKPYRGNAHYRLMQSLKSTGPQRCHYLIEGTKHFFTVLKCPSYGVLELA
jgi:hypothetical protein